MGNRATVAFPDLGLQVYLHWNGGLESVCAFLKYAEDVQLRTDDYFVSRFCQIIGNFMGGKLSLGVTPLLKGEKPNDPGDNGVITVTFDGQKIMVKDNEQSSIELNDMIRERSGSQEWKEYWNPKRGGTILDKVREDNDYFFKQE